MEDYFVEPLEDGLEGAAGEEFVWLAGFLGVLGHEGGVNAAEGDGCVWDDLADEFDGVGDGGVPVGHHGGDEDGVGRVFLGFVLQGVGEDVLGEAVAAVLAGVVFEAIWFWDNLVDIFSGAVGLGFWQL